MGAEGAVLDVVSGKVPSSLKLRGNEYWFGLECLMGGEGKVKEKEGRSWRAVGAGCFFVYPTKLSIDQLE